MLILGDGFPWDVFPPVFEKVDILSKATKIDHESWNPADPKPVFFGDYLRSLAPEIKWRSHRLTSKLLRTKRRRRDFSVFETLELWPVGGFGDLLFCQEGFIIYKPRKKGIPGEPPGMYKTFRK